MIRKALAICAISAFIAPSARAQVPVTIAKNGLGAPVYVTNIDAALAPYLTQTQAASTYLPLTGGNTTGALNGVNTFQGLIGSSASGASTVLTTDGSGAVNGTNCLQVPTQGVTKAVINVIGASTNGTDAVMQVYPGIALFTASSGTPALQGSSASFYPVFGSPSPWSVVPTVDTATKCVVITTKGSGTGSWKWRASIQYENLIP
ncbi:hypothetical protein [Asaia sp. HN010]|uniref:hypothetical protein n=1 Tax=Asaia sp. HN010 TaxID=3081233 RepID=UPI0030197511